jgi:hypothetical protein
LQVALVGKITMLSPLASKPVSTLPKITVPRS